MRRGSFKVLSSAIVWFVAAAGLAVWAAVEMGLLIPWCPAGIVDAPWRWKTLSAQRRPWLQFVALGTALTVFPLLLAHVRAATARRRRWFQPGRILFPGVWLSAVCAA